MRRTDYGPADVSRFREGIERHVVPLLRDIRAQQARDLGSSSVAPWDRGFFPAYALEPGIVPVEGQVAAARKVYGALDGRLVKHFDRMLAKGLVDIENRPGKRPGAYCTSMPDRDEVRIFCNSTGAASDVGTLLHESGHAFQGWESLPIPLVELQWPTYEACEIHSMGMEFLAFPHLSAFFAKKDHETRFKRQKLAKTIVLLAYVAVVDGFQHEVYERPGMTPDERAQTWSRLWSRFMVGEDWSGHEASVGRYWQRQLHVFGMPFYYVDYALAETCALQLYRASKKDPKDALRRYLRLCEVGGTRSFLGVLEEGGLASPFEPGTLPPLVDMVREELGL
jgi:M3 family oligoendopeptidase